MTRDADIAVVGAGVVGLAAAAALARTGRSVVVLEQHDRIGTQTSSRNSEVIHAGLYYETGSLKALTCVRGRRLLYERCQRLGIPHRKVGKVIVAVDDAQRDALHALHKRGLDNEAGQLSLLDAQHLRQLEPRVRAVAGIWSPETGIVDSHALMDSYRREAADHGAAFAFHTCVTGLRRSPGTWCVHTQNRRGEQVDLAVRWVVNAAGLASDRLAALSGVDVEARRWRLHPNKGDYFTLAPRLRGLTRHLVYPLPSDAGLGVHITMDLAGTLRAGPDTEWVDAAHYEVNPAKAAQFGQALRRYLPEVRDADLEPGYAGIRPKLAGPGDGFRDFVCEVADEAPGVVQLIGIESPGLTAAGALAERVVQCVERDGALG